jgi:hypothetical protein
LQIGCPLSFRKEKKLTIDNYRHNTRNQVNKLAFFMQLVEDSFLQYRNAVQISVLAERHFIKKIPPTEKEIWKKGGDTMMSNCVLFSSVS